MSTHDRSPRRRNQGPPRASGRGDTHRSKSLLAAEAIRAYIGYNEWQVGEIQASLQEADAGDFASDKDVASLTKNWKVNAG